MEITLTTPEIPTWTLYATPIALFYLTVAPAVSRSAYRENQNDPDQTAKAFVCYAISPGIIAAWILLCAYDATAHITKKTSAILNPIFAPIRWLVTGTTKPED